MADVIRHALSLNSYEWGLLQDRARAMGYPTGVDYTGMKVSDANSLIGEGIHLCQSGSILYSIFMSTKGGWWEPAEALAVSKFFDAPATENELGKGGKVSPVRKKRRTGCLRHSSSID